MDTRTHKGFSHGLEPGTTADLNCLSCQREDTEDLTHMHPGAELAVTFRRLAQAAEAEAVVGTGGEIARREAAVWLRAADIAVGLALRDHVNEGKS